VINGRKEEGTAKQVLRGGNIRKWGSSKQRKKGEKVKKRTLAGNCHSSRVFSLRYKGDREKKRSERGKPTGENGRKAIGEKNREA